MELFSPVIPIFLGPALAANGSDVYSRDDFPDGFVFASAASAYQWEGAANEDRRMPSFRDDFAHPDVAQNDDLHVTWTEKMETQHAMGITRVLEYFNQSYGNPPIYDLQNGYPMLHNSSLHDTSRPKGEVHSCLYWCCAQCCELWTVLCRLRELGFEEVSQTLCSFVLWFLKGMTVSSDRITELQKNFTTISHGYSSR